MYQKSEIVMTLFMKYCNRITSLGKDCTIIAFISNIKTEDKGGKILISCEFTFIFFNIPIPAYKRFKRGTLVLYDE